MANEELAFLTPGIEVSAKYRGAFCEAKVKKVDKNVKCKVTLKDDGKVLIVQDEDIRGSLRVGAAVEVRRPDTGLYVEGTVNRINDLSIYTVVFDDGDENTLRRTKLCLKGDRHFMKSETLDDLPLTHPEHFGTPVVKKAPKSKTATATCSESESDVESSDDDSETGSKRTTYSIHSQQNLVGRVLCVDFEERSRRAASTVPVLVVLPSADDVQLPSRHHLLVKSFKDGKFFTTTISNTKEFTSESTMKNKDKMLKTAFDKAQNYKECRELPPNWSKMELLGYSSSESGESSDDEPDEKKDRFVAELFKFMDDRGTPINKAPNLGGFDLNLFKLFRIVQSMGGYNRVTNQMKWHIVHSKLNLPSSASVVSTNIKQAYKKYLHAFEDFNRKLGCTMVMSSQSRMSSRSLVSFRERDRDQTLKHGRSKRFGSTKDEDVDKVIMHKKDVEPEKIDKQMATALAPIKTASDVSPLSISATFPVKTRTSKKSGAKKDSGDSDSVSSDIIITPKTSLSNPPSTCPSGKLSTEVAKPSVGPQRLTKEDEKHAQTSSKTTKEEPARVTRGDLLKTTRESAGKDDRPSVRKVDGRDLGRTKSEAEKSVEEKEEKQRGSRRMLRRAATIPSTEEEGEDETKSVNSEKTGWDEPSETVDSFIDEPKPDDEIPRVLTGRRQTICDDLHPVGTRMQVRYGKGKGQKIYEAKVLDTSVQSGVAKYFVHYNGWNSRYDEWIHKDVIVNILEEPGLEMPKLRSSTTPSAKIMPLPMRRRTNLSSGSPLPSNKDDTRFGKSKVTHFGLEHTSSASRRTRSNSIDQMKPSSGRSRNSSLKASEAELNIGNNGTSSSSNSSSSLSSSSEEPLVTEPKTEQNTDEDLSNSYHSCSPADTPEMPDIYNSEEDEFGRDAVPKLHQDRNAPDTPDLPLIKLDMAAEQLDNVSFELDNTTLEQEACKPLRNEKMPLSDSFSIKNDEMPVIEIQCKVEETAMHSDDISVKQLDEVTPNNSVLECKDEQKENLVTETADDTSTIEAGNNMAALGLSETENTMPSTAEESDNIRDLPSLTESSVTKTRRKKKMQERALESSSDDTGHDIKNDIKSTDGKNVPGLPTEGEKKACVRKRKQSCSFDFGEGTSDEQIKKNAYSDTESKMEDETAVETNDCKFRSVKRTSALTKEPTVGKDKALKKAAKMSKTGCNPDDRGSEKILSDSLESELSWKRDVELDLKHADDCKETTVDQCSSKQSRKLESSQMEEEYETTAHEAVDDRLQPSTCPLPDNAEDIHTRDEDADLSDFAVKCSEEMGMKNVFNDSPPASAENSPMAPDEASSPSHEELTSTKSEQEANLEVEKFMERRMESSLYCDSQSGYDFSTASSDSTTSSGSIIRGFDNELPTPAMCRKKKVEEESSGIHPWKRRRERNKDECLERDLSSKAHYRSESNDSDHDNSLSKSGRSTISSSSPAKSSLHCESMPSCHRQQPHHLHRQSKYNFIDLEEGKYLEGEDRIIFLTNKIQDLRAAYMELKAEVASIDRRRRRHRVKEKEMAQLSTIGGSSSSTMTST